MFKFLFYSLILAGLLCIGAIVLPHDTGHIQGYLMDEETKEFIPFANVLLQKDSAGKIITLKSATSNIDGEFLFKNVPVGSYKVFGRYVGYSQKLMTEVPVKKDSMTFVYLGLLQGKNLREVEVVKYSTPLTDPHSKHEAPITREEYHDLAPINPRVCMPEGVYSPDTPRREIKPTLKTGETKRKMKKS